MIYIYIYILGFLGNRYVHMGNDTTACPCIWKGKRSTGVAKGSQENFHLFLYLYIYIYIYIPRAQANP